jgi:hypothetical protein
MAQTRRVFNGITVETAARKRLCYHNRRQHSVGKGESCLVIKDASGAGKKQYCVTCGLAILDLASDDLEALRHLLDSQS